MRKSTIQTLVGATALALLPLAVPAFAQADSASPAKAAVLVLDASGSMWGQLDGGITKIEIARDVMGQFFSTRDTTIPLGVIAYGHNRRGDCSDIEVIAAAGVQDPGALSQRLNRINPRGMTPISESLRMAASQIPPTAEEADIILVTDGLETCNADPCAVAAQLANEGIKIRAHVVGFGLTEQEAQALACVPDQTGGQLLRPQSGAELTDALNQIAEAEPVPEPEPETSTLFSTHFVFRDTGTGTPRGLMEWSATAPDGTVISLGTTEGTQQSLEGRSVQLPGGEWTIVAEGPEGRAELTFTLVANGGSHGVPFIGVQMSAEIPPIGQVQAGMGARIPFTITHRGSGNLGGTPYKYIATGPEGALTRNQIVRDDLITSRELGTYGGATGALEPGTYRLLVAIARQSGYEILAERTFEAVENPIVNIVGPDRAQPGEAISLSFDGGYATNYHFFVVDENDRNLTQGRALYQGPGGGGGGPLSLDVRMPNQEGTFDIVVRRDDDIIARKPITLGDAPAAATQAAPGQDDLPMVRATFRVPDGFPETPLWWSAVPLDPDMSPEAWAPQTEMWIAEGEFEPGRYEVSTMGPGEVEFRAVVEIVPGQANDFVIPVFGPGEEDPQPGDQRGDAAPAYPPGKIITLMLPREVEGQLVQWSAIRLDRNMQDVEFAMHDYMGNHTTGFAHGRYAITGAGENFTLKGEISVEPSGQSNFVIPLSTEASAEESQGMTCDVADGCAYRDPVTGLAVTLPQGWEISPPFFYETAAGSSAQLPSATFARPSGGAFQQIMLNPRQWMASSGPCVETPAGELCRAESADVGYLSAFEVIRSSLKLETASAPQADTVLEAGIDVAVLCDGDTNCTYFDPDTGLRMVVPAGWAMGEASFVSATAGAIPQENPRISFFRIGGSDEERFEFNPHQWLNSNGPCESTLIGGVCHFADAPESTKLAMMTAGLHARIDKDAAATGGNVFEHKAGTSFDPRGPYAAGQKTVFIVRRDKSLESDEIAVFPARGPLSETTILSRNRDLGRGYYGSVTMPAEPGAYRIALLREGDRIVQGVTEITVEADPAMHFTDWNAQPFPGRPLSVNLHGRMAYDDAIAILTPDGRELSRASVFEAMTGYLRTPEGLSGAHRLVHIARGAARERQMASVDLDIGARGNKVDAGGASGAPVISVAPKVLAGSRVEVSVRGAIPEKPVLGFIKPGAGENQILETGQHFRPDMPSTTVNAPRKTGQWMMRLTDQNLWRFAEVPVEVVDTLDEAEPEAVSGRDIKPRDGTWTVAIGNTALEGCPAMIADQIRSAGMQGRSSSRNITFADPFHPAPLMEDSAMRVDWEKTGPGGWQARLVQQSMGQMGSVEARYELTVVSETELREVSHFSLQLPAELMAVTGGGDGKCTSRTNATWNWQG